MKKAALLAKWENQLRVIINPDDMKDWDELGFDEAPEGFKTVDDWLENSGEAEFDEGQQVEIRCIKEFLEDLEKLEG